MRVGLSGTLLLGAVLIGPGIPMAAAQHSGHGDHGSHSGHGMSIPSAPTVRTGKIKGRLVQVDSESITVETEKKGKTSRITYMLDARTKKKGALETGSEVEVKFRDEAGAPSVATSVETKKPKKRA